MYVEAIFGSKPYTTLVETAASISITDLKLQEVSQTIQVQGVSGEYKTAVLSEPTMLEIAE